MFCLINSKYTINYQLIQDSRKGSSIIAVCDVPKTYYSIYPEPLQESTETQEAAFPGATSFIQTGISS
jgi:hypothetical protein